MIKSILKLVVGNRNQRILRKILPIVEKINNLEKELQNQDESILFEKTSKWKEYLSKYDIRVNLYSKRSLESFSVGDNKKNLTYWSTKFENLVDEYKHLSNYIHTSKINDLSNEEIIEFIIESQNIFFELKEKFPEARAKYLDKILPEVFAVVKNASRRLCGQEWKVCDQLVKWDMIHFDVQLIGGIALHKGMISEMATGEGKTLVATLPVFLNSLTGMGVHVITVNDYLARRDSEWMGYLFEYLGVSVGCIQNDQSSDERKEQYKKDITYGTASEFGFDYLRDNGMAQERDHQVQRGHYFALIDEVDSVLIDEARTPLIISGPVTVSKGEQFSKYKSNIDKLYKKQIQLCNDLSNEAKHKLNEGQVQESGLIYYKLKLGMPRNVSLLRAMENPEVRRAMEKAELEFYRDPHRKALFELREELYFTLDSKDHEAELTEKGRQFLDPDNINSFLLPDISEEFSIIDGDDSLSDEEKNKRKNKIQQEMSNQAEKVHTISQLLKAYTLYEKDVHYVVENNSVLIVDENTGRKMPGRRWSDGLHQAVEAKESVSIEEETQTYATITIQNYFRLYEKLGGMTGTAETEASEFHDIYKLEVFVVPTNKPIARKDLNDKIFKTQREKFNAVIDLVKKHHASKQPILLGTASVESSEVLSRMLKKEKIPHSVLNAKFHMQEADIVSRAGQAGSVTVATNMAGRGTDIKLGQNVLDYGGLFVIGTERHSSRRVDRQLRGRCSRQGDLGMSVFYLSFEDDLMMQFGAADRMTKMMERLGLEEGQELQHPWLNKSVENAQKKVEQRDYLSRKHILEYDDVMNNQRSIVYDYRNEVILSEDPSILIIEIIEETVPLIVDRFFDSKSQEIYVEGLVNELNIMFPIAVSNDDIDNIKNDHDKIINFIIDQIRSSYKIKIKYEDSDNIEGLERFIILHSIDKLWQEHLYEMDNLRESIGNYRYAQKDPLIEYKHVAYDLFTNLMERIKMDVMNNLFRVTTTKSEDYESFLHGVQMSKNDISFDSKETTSNDDSFKDISIPKTITRNSAKVGRNNPCSCGSGKKYKQCCGKNKN